MMSHFNSVTRVILLFLVGLVALISAILVPLPTLAQEDPEEPPSGIEAMTDYYMLATMPRWQGARNPHPLESPRPLASQSLASQMLPLVVHGDARTTPARMERALLALENAYLLLHEAEWPLHLPDGERGGGGQFDLYLTQDGPFDSGGVSDGPIAWSHLDAVATHGVMNANVSTVDFEACATQAYIDAVLLGLDPAESIQWRRATAAWLTWMITAQFGCSDSVVGQQREPFRSPIDNAVDSGAGGGMFVAFLSERHDHGTGRFIRDMWQMTRQRTWNSTDGYRASPDLWEAIDAATRRVEDPLTRQIADFAVGRWFVGERAIAAPTAYGLFRRMPATALIPPLENITKDDLPEHSDIADPGLDPFGSAYVWVDLAGIPEDQRLRCWFRGEFGVGWAYSAVRVGSDRGAEAIEVPPRDVHGRGYTIVELLSDTEGVLLVATNLSTRLPDADEPDDNVRAFKAIVSLVDPSEPAAE